MLDFISICLAQPKLANKDNSAGTDLFQVSQWLLYRFKFLILENNPW